MTVQTDARRKLELAIARLLNVGTLTSMALLAVGVLLMVVRGQSPLAGDAPALDLGRIPADIVALRPEGFLWLGLIAVIGTPTSRVVASVVGFASAGEREMVLISLGVLAIIAAGVALSIGAAA